MHNIQARDRGPYNLDISKYFKWYLETEQVTLSSILNVRYDVMQLIWQWKDSEVFYIICLYNCLIIQSMGGLGLCLCTRILSPHLMAEMKTFISLRKRRHGGTLCGVNSQKTGHANK